MDPPRPVLLEHQWAPSDSLKNPQPAKLQLLSDPNQTMKARLSSDNKHFMIKSWFGFVLWCYTCRKKNPGIQPWLMPKSEKTVRLTNYTPLTPMTMIYDGFVDEGTLIDVLSQTKPNRLVWVHINPYHVSINGSKSSDTNQIEPKNRPVWPMFQSWFINHQLNLGPTIAPEGQFPL